MEPPRPHSTNTTATILPKKRKFLSGEECGSSSVVAGSAGLESMASSQAECSSSGPEQGSAAAQAAKRNRRSYSLEFKVAVLDSYYNDTQTRLNQRKTALKYGVNRRQIQKWLAQEETLRGSVGAGYTATSHSLTGSTAQYSTATPTTSLLEVTPEIETEAEYVIDESRYPSRDYGSAGEEDTPINLSTGGQASKDKQASQVGAAVKAANRRQQAGSRQAADS